MKHKTDYYLYVDCNPKQHFPRCCVHLRSNIVCVDYVCDLQSYYGFLSENLALDCCEVVPFAVIGRSQMSCPRYIAKQILTQVTAYMRLYDDFLNSTPLLDDLPF